MRGTTTLLALILGLTTACGGPSEPAQAPDPEPMAEPDPTPAPPVEDDPPPEEDKPAAAASVEPEFKDGMSVDEAINAVPQGGERVNLDQETLGQPLMDMKVYEPCKPKPSQHVKIKVAIWDGKAVGVDVEATPKNDQLASCVKDQIRGLSWRDKVKSLNTVEYGF